MPFLWEMLYEAIFVPEGEAAPPREIVRDPSIRHYVEGYGRPGDLGVVALGPQGERLGAAWCRLLSGADPGYGYVADDVPEVSVAVRRGRRGAGIGTALVGRLMADVAAAGYRRVSLGVHPLNPARRLYERLGFRLVSQAGGAHVMVAHLTAAPGGGVQGSARPPWCPCAESWPGAARP